MTSNHADVVFQRLTKNLSYIEVLTHARIYLLKKCVSELVARQLYSPTYCAAVDITLCNQNMQIPFTKLEPNLDTILRKTVNTYLREGDGEASACTPLEHALLHGYTLNHAIFMYVNRHHCHHCTLFSFRFPKTFQKY